jgi:hypothetical protein
MNGSSQVTEHGTNGTYTPRSNGSLSQTPVDEVASSKKVLVHEDPEEQKDASGPCSGCCAPEGRPAYVFLRLFIVIIAGIIFGWCLEKGRGNSGAFCIFTFWYLISQACPL